MIQILLDKISLVLKILFATVLLMIFLLIVMYLHPIEFEYSTHSEVDNVMIDDHLIYKTWTSIDEDGAIKVNLDVGKKTTMVNDNSLDCSS